MKKIIPLLLCLLFTTIACKTQDMTDTYTIETSLGNIKVKLYDNTPLHKANFERLVEEQLYDSTLFHRVINEFMIQGGDLETKPASMQAKVDKTEEEKTIPAEFVRENFHKKGALAAARMGDQVNPEKRSSPTQFYIVHGRSWTDAQLKEIEDYYGSYFPENQKEVYKSLGGTPFLDNEYTVFGEVVEGLGVVNQIASVATGSMDRPREDVYIIRIVKD
ncbi:peptidylprolyl isomerase [Bacteroidales bacterium OttesenSCG-928-M11]|nr:peptidylprolyl isomerase [Bacteroidales bacterium OttesenSCG-928-M11]